MSDLLGAAKNVVGYWDGLWAVESDDPRPTEEFRDELDRLINTLRNAIEGFLADEPCPHCDTSNGHGWDAESGSCAGCGFNR